MTPNWFNKSIRKIDDAAVETARSRQDVLLKPRGSMGVLEELAIRLAAMQKSGAPSLDKVRFTVFAADHGVSKEDVSVLGAGSTSALVDLLIEGGSALSVMVDGLGADLEVVDVGLNEDPKSAKGVVDARVAKGTRNIRKHPAMSPEQLSSALKVGRKAVERAESDGVQLFVGGELGVGGSTSSAAVASALLGVPPGSVAGPGSGLDEKGIALKADVISDALDLHAKFMTPAPLTALLHLGGLEMAALVGSYVTAGQRGMPFMVDGFTSAAAALIAITIKPALINWAFFAHYSAEPGQRSILNALRAPPLLDLGVHLGHGAGAALAVPVLRTACDLHARMGTLDKGRVPFR